MHLVSCRLIIEVEGMYVCFRITMAEVVNVRHAKHDKSRRIPNRKLFRFEDEVKETRRGTLSALQKIKIYLRISSQSWLSK